MTRTLPLLIAFILFAAPAFAQRGGSVSSDYAANLEARLQTLEEQLARMTGQIEQAQHQARQAQERLARLEQDLETRFRMIEQNQQQAALVPENANTLPPALNGNGLNPEDEKLMGQLTGTPGNSGEDEGAKDTSLPDDPSQAYDKAFRLIRDGDYDAAEAAMKEFLKRWPKHELASNASYWLSETYYVRGDFKQAAKGFAETYQKFPRGTKAEDTLLKLAMSLSALDRDKDACVTFDQLAAEYPHMSQSNRKRMEQERQNLQCASASGGSKRAR